MIADGRKRRGRAPPALFARRVRRVPKGGLQPKKCVVSSNGARSLTKPLIPFALSI
jgi:hypothetical protein